MKQKINFIINQKMRQKKLNKNTNSPIEKEILIKLVNQQLLKKKDSNKKKSKKR